MWSNMSYFAQLAANKQSEDNAIKPVKWKRYEEEISEIKVKKQRMQGNAQALHKAASELAEKVEDLSKLTLFAQSNSLRKVAIIE